MTQQLLIQFCGISANRLGKLRRNSSTKIHWHGAKGKPNSVILVSRMEFKMDRLLLRSVTRPTILFSLLFRTINFIF